MASNALDGMTQAKWDSLSRADRERIRDYSGPTPQLKGLEGYRVEVVDSEGGTPRRFQVGMSTGWRPCHLEVANRRSSGGGAASKQYASVKVIRLAR